MTATSPKAFMISAALHGAVVALLFLFSFISARNDDDAPKVFELVAGEGDNYAAKEAPALGTPDGIKVPVTAPPAPVPEQPKVEPAPTPVEPAPTPPPKTEVKPAPPTQKTTDTSTPDFSKKIKRDIVRAESKVKQQLKKQHEAEAKKQAEEQKRQAEEQKRLTKEEFDRTNKPKQVASSSTPKASAPNIKKIDTEGITKGVLGGSTENKVGGAGGKALKTDNADVLAAYDMLFKQRLRERFEPPPGLSDSLKGTFEVRSNPDGSLVGARVIKSSGSNEFDQAVLDAIRRVRMPARPDNKAETYQFVFTMRERDEG